MKHEISRYRHELKRRALTVRSVERVTPDMARIVLEGADLEGFTSLSPDDHVKLFFPVSGSDELEMRDYTPRRYDAASGLLTLDFALHDPAHAGPATLWALSARPGDMLQMGGPKGSMVVPYDYDWWLLIGDETALPAIGRRLEEMPPGTRVTTLVAVTGPEEEQRFDTRAAHRSLWVHRPAAQADDPSPLLQALKHEQPSQGEGFISIAAEAKVASALKEFVTVSWRHDPAWMKSKGYWTSGQAGD
jgi:NADPH-dependent ferric siderophore reductase